MTSIEFEVIRSKVNDLAIFDTTSLSGW